MSHKDDKQERAQRLLMSARDLGIAPTLGGNWVRFDPALPPALLIDALGLGDEMAQILMRETE